MDRRLPTRAPRSHTTEKMPDHLTDETEMRPEYNFGGGVRGKYAEPYRSGHLRLTMRVEPEGSGFVSLCPELDVASQGDTVDKARANLTEAVALFLETADNSEIRRRLEQ